MGSTDARRRSRRPRLGTELAHIPSRRGIANLARRRLDIARTLIKIGMFHTERQAILCTEIAHKGLIAVGRLASQMMVYMKNVQALASNGGGAAPILDIQL